MSTERFVAVLAGIVAVLGGMGAMIRLLAVISWRLGQVVTQFADHVASDEKIHKDIERRMRAMERAKRRR